MSTEKQSVKVKDLVDEAKKRIVFLITCVVGLSYLMSLTSSSVWVNLPAAAFVIILLRYFSVDFEMRRKAAAYNNSKSASLSTNTVLQRNPLESSSKVLTENSDWRRKVNSPVVEDAIDHFTRHIVSEWVTDLWYSRITPDKQAPEELALLINSVLGEISSRIKNINLIDLLTSDIINIFCTQLELFRTCQTKSEKLQMGSLSIEQRDIELKSVLAADNKLHPVLFSAESEHKVLQHIMEGLISFTFKPEDLNCSLFHFIVRELLACAVMRPVLNLANPRFVNERIENLVIARRNKADKGPNPTTQVVSQSNSDGSSKVSSTYQISRSLDPSAKGVELVQLKKDIPESNDNENENILSKDPLLSVDARSTRSWGSLPSDSPTSEQEGIQRHHSGGNGREWGDMLDIVSRRKTETLAPEHFENVWTKGRNYKKKETSGRLTESSIQQTSSSAKIMEHSKGFSKNREKVGVAAKGNGRPSLDSKYNISALSKSDCTLLTSFDEDDEFIESGSNSSSYTSSEDEEEEDPTSVTGLDSPGIKVWDGKSNRNNSDTHIHHPLESSDKHKTRKTNKDRVESPKVHRSQSVKQRSRLNNKNNVHVWQEVERTSFPLGDGQDILNSSLKGHVKSEESSGDSEGELFGRIYSGSTASSSLSSISVPEGHNFSANTPKISLMEDSFLTLRCEVLGANIVKSGSTTFAVYSISVMDIDNSSWSIKRRFRHFEELHRRLKEFPEYRLHLPPKHFLSTGLDVPVIQERCKLLDIYLKKLLQLPTISGSIEVWDFLSVDSQTYSFTNSISIIETLPVDLEGNSRAKQKDGGFHVGPVRPRRELINQESSKESMSPRNVENLMANGQMSNTKYIPFPPPRKPAKYRVKPLTDSGSDSDNSLKKKTISSETRILGTVPEGDDSSLHASPGSHADSLSDPALPSEWVPPNLSAPILDLVDVIFQVQDGGWIRRKAFWVAKQVLQLGMGDAFDDWLIEKIQILRRGSVVASGINRLEQILWPDGIFLTKHPNRQRPNPNPNPAPTPTPPGQPHTPPSASQADEIQKLNELQQKEAQRRAEFVYELMIDKAPATIVGLVGRKEYEQCAKDLYYFIQSAVCLKQLVFELLELLLLSAFPEMDYVFKQLHEEKHRFGELEQQN